jgi:3-deoxy-D-manno-octulosonic-acid transferase
MTLLYNFAIAIFYLGFLVASLFNSKAKKIIKGHRRLFRKLKEAIGEEDNILWFHAASTGEFEQGRPVIEAIRQKYPQYKILLTFFSSSGYEAKKNYQGADYIFYMPFDFSWNARLFYRIVRPKAVFIIKYEFWYNFINVARKKNIPIFCFSAIFRPGQVFFKWYGGWYKNILRKFTCIFVQNADSLYLLNAEGIKNVVVCGDTRFDRVNQIAVQSKNLPLIENFVQNAQQVIIAGSTWPADEELLVAYFNKKSDGKPSLKMIIVPHEIDDENHLNELIRSFNCPSVRYSAISESTDISNFRVLIIDTIGILSSVYRYGYFAYIGGGFGKGIHNILEAATYGIPVVFGPKYKKFQEAVELIDRKGAFSIDNLDDMENIFDKLLNNKDFYQSACGVCRKYVEENLGSTEKFLQYVSPLIFSDSK